MKFLIKCINVHKEVQRFYVRRINLRYFKAIFHYICDMHFLKQMNHIYAYRCIDTMHNSFVFKGYSTNIVKMCLQIPQTYTNIPCKCILALYFILSACQLCIQMCYKKSQNSNASCCTAFALFILDPFEKMKEKVKIPKNYEILTLHV